MPPPPRSSLLPVFAGLLLVTPLLIVPGLYEPSHLPQAAFLEVGAFALLAAALLRGEIQTPGGAVLSLGRPWVLLVGLAFLSLAWAHNLREALPEAIRWLAVLALFWLAASLARSRRDGQLLLGALFGAGALASTLGLLQFYLGVTWVPQAFPPAATFMNRNVAASFVVAAWPLGLLVASQRRRPLRLLVALATGCMLAFIFHTFTKSAWLALSVQMLVAFVWAASRRGRASLPRPDVAGVTLAAAVCALLVLAGPAGLRPRFAEAVSLVVSTWRTAPSLRSNERVPAVTSAEHANSIRSRRALFFNTASMVRDHPLLGVGIGNHDVHYPAYARRVVADPGHGFAQIDYAHDDPLQLVSELGLLGALLGAWWVVAIARQIRHRALRQDDPALTFAVALSLAGLGADALFNFPFQRAAHSGLVAVALGLLAATQGRPARGESDAAEAGAPPAVLTRAFGFVVAGLTVAVAVAQVRVLSADHLVLRARQAAARRDWVTAQTSAAEALGHDGRRREALFLAGQAALERRDPRLAASLFLRLLVGYPHDVASLGNLAAAERDLRNPQAARAALERLVVLWPEDYRAHTALARELEEAGDLEGAGRHHGISAALEPENPMPPFLQGVAALQRRDLGTAEAALRQAVARAPQWAQPHKALGVCLLERGRRDEGIVHLRRALELDPALPDAARMRALLVPATP